MSVIYLDSNVLIEMIERSHVPHTAMARLRIQMQLGGKPQVVTSQITLAEVLVQPLRVGDLDLAQDYIQMLSQSQLQVFAVDDATLFDASLLRADNRHLKLFDAVHIATARTASADMIVSRDSDLLRVQPGATCASFGVAGGMPLVCTPDDPAFAALLAGEL